MSDHIAQKGEILGMDVTTFICYEKDQSCNIISSPEFKHCPFCGAELYMEVPNAKN